MYGRYTWLERLGDWRFTAPKSELAREMKVPMSRLETYLGYLVDWGLLEKLRINKYNITMQLKAPIDGPEEQGGW
jgi:DNA-binding IclR family transcriptional regulator